VARLLARLVSMNDGWARPFGDFNHRWASALFRPIRPIQDLLHGRWLGHPLHAATTDIPIGLLLGTVVLDIVGQPAAADIALLVTILFMILSAVSGLADYAVTDGTARTRATLHGTLMVIGLVVLVASAVLRSGAPADRTVPIALSIAGLLVVTAGAFVGGDVVFLLGNMVSRHAFRGPGTKWVRLDTGELTDLAALPDATPTKMRAGINELVVVRRGEAVHALHAVCAHAGGPLDQGTLTADGCLQCPWHGARYRLSDGAVRRGPSVYDQPAYEIRNAEGGGYEVRRAGRT
jgi:nitrite reductase/ring-hydroxylating ferredoxin subunit